jgi:hypothetical protein
MTRQKTNARVLAPESLGFADVRRLAQTSLTAGVSVLLRGHPGVGKSSMAADIARSMSLPLIDIRLAQRDPAELAGVYFPDREASVLELFPPGWVRQAVDAPALVFLDEINAGVTRLHQAAAYQIVLERRVGPFAFHPDTVVMAAGNLATDQAIVTTLSSALCNRFAHFTVGVDPESWLAWGADHDIDPRILAYIGRHGAKALYQQTGEHAFPSPRSWAMASQVLWHADEGDTRRVLTALVGVEAAERFVAYLRIYQRVNAEAIVLKGKTMDFTKGKHAEPSFVYAAVFSVAAWLVNEAGRPADGRTKGRAPLTDKALANVPRFLRSKGLDPEYVFLFLRQLKRAPEVLARLRTQPAFQTLAGQMVALHVSLYR